ncbi:hypothetical protein FCULG_00007863 [Fusarium culmorum]|uniref:Myb-like domain-containing protein n=1 Tax=Fusarium culmorum TaxID=5516 RepID=A0A2T4H075_FUSCU|nr:hypothetical protein FCULG_00007863 [Fusarium culmorum]
MVAPLSPQSFHEDIQNIIFMTPPPPSRVRSRALRAPVSSSAGDTSSGYESGTFSFPHENTCNKNRTLKCTKPCCKGKATQIPSETETDTQTGEGSTDLETSVRYTNPPVEDPTWSISEDCLLRGLKENDEPWKFIAKCLRKSKSDVRLRWKILQNQTIISKPTKPEPVIVEVTAEPGSGETTTEEESDRAVAEVASGAETTSDNKTGDQDEESEESSEEEDEDEDDDEDDEEQVEDTEEETDFVPKAKGKAQMLVKNKWHRGPRNRKVAIENKFAKARAKAKVHDNDDSPMESGQVSDDSLEYRLEFIDLEKVKQMKYLHEEIYDEMYPADIHPQPNAYFNAQDCALLATIDSKYKRSRWLEMQANFYNVTGRMVPLEAIRDRCERAEAEKEARSDARKLERRIKRVVTWMEKQVDEESSD